MKRNVALVVIDCQNDFVRPTGKLAVPGAEAIIPNIVKLVKHAQHLGIKIVFTQDWHPKTSEEFKVWPEHCVENTVGADIIPEILGEVGAAQIIQKDWISAWKNPGTEQIFEGFDEIFVAGVATEYCVKEFVLGACSRGIEVSLISDATKGVDEIAGVPNTMGNVIGACVEMGMFGACTCKTVQLLEKNFYIGE